MPFESLQIDFSFFKGGSRTLGGCYIYGKNPGRSTRRELPAAKQEWPNPKGVNDIWPTTSQLAMYLEMGTRETELTIGANLKLIFQTNIMQNLKKYKPFFLTFRISTLKLFYLYFLRSLRSKLSSCSIPLILLSDPISHITDIEL